ncbi:MAG: twin-arginine translocation signal domain-containing protein [Candidatus Synoicihabitans palmerolidicus]|nr:twin-arginine translocation signal domain-containing protein [Candidatus Synoicihabitans palmerolidicus]
MSNPITRRSVLKNLATGSALAASLPLVASQLPPHPSRSWANTNIPPVNGATATFRSRISPPPLRISDSIPSSSSASRNCLFSPAMASTVAWSGGCPEASLTASTSASTTPRSRRLWRKKSRSWPPSARRT